MSTSQYIKRYYDYFPDEVRQALQHTELCPDPIVNIVNPKTRDDIVEWLKKHEPYRLTDFLASEQLNSKKKKYEIRNKGNGR